MVSGLRDGGAGRRLRLGMVGGGRGAFIGAVHRLCARMDDAWELVAGALSSDPQRARESAADLMIAADRASASGERAQLLPIRPFSTTANSPSSSSW